MEGAHYQQMSYIDITSLSPSKVVIALHAAARPACDHLEDYQPGTCLNEIDALRCTLAHHGNLGIERGRHLHFNIGGTRIDPTAYDRENGAGTAARVISILQRTSDPRHPEILLLHQEGLATLRAQLDQKDPTWRQNPTYAKLVEPA